MADTSLEIAVQPPSVARIGYTLNPPLAAKLSSTTAVNGYCSDLSRVWAFATLIDNHGDVVNDHLSGNFAESAQTFQNGDDSACYFLFDNLSIGSVGSFRIRVTLMRMDNSAAGAASVQQVESNLIVVKDEEVERVSPSDFERRFLDSLTN